MSNVAIAYPNRMLELKTLHNCDWQDNSISPLANIETPILSETGRTSDYNGGSSALDKHCSFGVSLANLPYRTFGAIGLVNHNLTIASKVRFIVFNEPPIAYSKNTLAFNWVGGTAVTITMTVSVPTIAIGTKLKFYACSSDKADTSSGEYFRGTVSADSLGNQLSITFDGGTDGHFGDITSPIYSLWYIGYGAQTGQRESLIKNTPLWVNVWKRIYQSNSEFLTWNSKNLWGGTIEEEQRLSFTKINISFLKDSVSGNQPVGSHIHIDINDTDVSLMTDKFIELGRVFIGQYSQPTINPEYGAIDHNFIDNSELTTANSSTEYAYEKAKARIVSVQWNHLTEDEAFGGIYEASRSQGITREVLYAYDVDDTGSYQYARSFIGRFTQLNAITIPNPGQYGASINLKEIL